MLNDNTHSGQFCQRRLYVTQPWFSWQSNGAVYRCCVEKKDVREYSIYPTLSSVSGDKGLAVDGAGGGGGGPVGITGFLSGFTRTLTDPGTVWCECVSAPASSHIHMFAEVYIHVLYFLNNKDVFFIIVNESLEITKTVRLSDSQYDWNSQVYGLCGARQAHPFSRAL